MFETVSPDLIKKNNWADNFPSVDDFYGSATDFFGLIAFPS